MKRISILLFLIILLPICLLAQSETWPVKAFVKKGKAYPVSVYLEDGTAIPLFAIYEAGNDHFMDVKGVHNGQKISIKLVLTNDFLIPVKGIMENGDILKVKAEDSDGNIIDPNCQGIARELARMNLPVNIYTQWYWKIDLHNLLHFLLLRADSHAQYEIRVFADVMLDIY